MIETGDEHANLRDSKVSKIVKPLSTKKVLVEPNLLQIQLKL